MNQRILNVDQRRLAELCQLHGIRRLAVFGSATRDELGPDSDIDLLVEFIPGQEPGLEFIAIQDELSSLVGREVDLNTPGFLSRHFRDRVTAEAIPIYEAA
ncbi:MAG: nucleotidyltransferase family protein [Thermoanaerobaculia bacterium]